MADEDFDEQELDGSSEGDEDESGAGEATDRKALLRTLIEAGGDFGKLAAGALEALEEREAAASHQAELLAVAEDTGPERLHDLFETFDGLRMDPEADPDEVREAEARVNAVKDALGAAVIAEWAKVDAALLTETAEVLRKQGFADETVAEKLSELKAQQEVLLAEEGSRNDAFEDHQVWRDYQREALETRRAAELARQMQAERPDAWERASAEAQAANDAFVDSLAG